MIFDLNSFRLGVAIATAVIVFSKKVENKKSVKQLKQFKIKRRPNPKFIPPATIKQKKKNEDNFYPSASSIHYARYDQVIINSNEKNVGYVLTQYLTDVCDKTQSFHLTGRVRTTEKNPFLNVLSQPCANGIVIRRLGNNVEVDIIEHGALWSKIDLTRYQYSNDKESYKSVYKIFQNAMTAKDAASTYKHYEALNKSFDRMEESI